MDIQTEKRHEFQEIIEEISLDYGGGTRKYENSTFLDEDSQIVSFESASFYKTNAQRRILAFIVNILGLGFPYLISIWIPRLYPKINFWEAVDGRNDQATFVALTAADGSVSIENIFMYDMIKKRMVEAFRWIRTRPKSIPRMFMWREERFWFSPKDGHWTRRKFNLEAKYGELHKIGIENSVIGFSKNAEQVDELGHNKRQIFGPNILRVQVPRFITLVITEALKPFFIFQVFSVTSWLLLDYALYAYIIILLTVMAVFYSSFEQWVNLHSVQRLAATEILVKRVRVEKLDKTNAFLSSRIIPSSQLNPGDLVEIEQGLILPCDFILLTGQCVVNEAMLTGESSPVQKSYIPPDFSPTAPVYDGSLERDGKYRLLSGTQVIQTKRSRATALPLPTFSLDSLKDPISIWQLAQHLPDGRLPTIAMVSGTSYATAKGQLIRAILYPKPSKNDYETKLYYFVVNLIVFLIVGSAFIIFWQWGKKSAGAITLEIVNLITITIPPQLPLALSISLSTSFNRLLSKGITCINPGRIMAAGRVNLAAFDKTGTLTQDGLSLRGVCPIDQDMNGEVLLGNISHNVIDIYAIANEGLKFTILGYNNDIPNRNLALFRTLVSCHSLSVIDLPSPSRRGPEFTRSHSSRDRDANFTIDMASTSDSVQYIGDPLEIEVFLGTGWHYTSRPDSASDSGPSDLSIWNLPHIDPSVDVILIPPSTMGPAPNFGLAIIRRFDFDSDIRMMSVIVGEVSLNVPSEITDYWMLTKGAPESVQELCDPISLPPNYEGQLQNLAMNGDRLLACAYQPLSHLTKDMLLTANRSDLEKNLTFTGLIVMENRLKPVSVRHLAHLNDAGIRSVMVTGDNPLTAVAVARKCGPYFLRPNDVTFLVDLVRKPKNHVWSGCVLRDLSSQREYDLDHVLSTRDSIGQDPEEGMSKVAGEKSVSLAITGRAFNALLVQHEALKLVGEAVYGMSISVDGKPMPSTPLEMVVVKAGVFARMSPRNKLDLMYCFQDLGYTVCMTGDGANDSSAMKAADVGISIASNPDEDDSVAAAPSIAAPFSTHISHIGVVPEILCEGRCALVNATTMFKYMFFYALIQTTAVISLYYHGEDLSEYEYLYGDLFIVFVLVLLLPGMEPSKRLSKGRPESNLLSAPILVSVYGQSIILVSFQLLTFYLLQQQSWYSYDSSTSSSVSYYTQDSTVMFIISSFQYTTIAMALSQGFGLFRASVFSNRTLCVTFVIQLIVSSVITVYPPNFLLDLLRMVDLRSQVLFLLSVWLLAIANGVSFVLFERYAVRHVSTDPDSMDEVELRSSFWNGSYRQSNKSQPRFIRAKQHSEPTWQALGQSVG